MDYLKESFQRVKQDMLFLQNQIDVPTHNIPRWDLKPINLGISIGNDGVPTNKQTNQQTDQQTKNQQKIDLSLSNNPPKDHNAFDDAIKIIESLDNIKKDLRLKFKKLTDQELLVFSTLYQLEEEFGYTDYKTLSKRLNLTESSIRDYIRKLLKKGISIEKIKINNKNIHLVVSKNLKKIAPLKTILQLRDL